MGILAHEKILELHAAVISARLTRSRAALFAGLDDMLVDGLEQLSEPSAQVLADLHALNAVGELGDGSVPLAVWLQNGVRLTGLKREGRVFQDALRAVQVVVPSSLRHAQEPATEATVHNSAMGSELKHVVGTDGLGPAGPAFPNLTKPAPARAPASAPKQTLIMKGGGVKGLALAGAIMELEKYYTFSTFVGTSAGAIAAVLLAAGYSASELQQELRTLNFRDFLDSSWGRGLPNLVFTGGLNTGAPIVDWIATRLQKRASYANNFPLERLPHRAIIYAALKGRGELEFDSQGTNRSLDASFAARCSMSIPGFFAPQEHEGRRVYDGGLLNNFPVEVYLRRGGSPDFIALYLGSDKVSSRRRGWQIMDVLDILLSRNEPAMVDQYREQTIIIDTEPIGTVDFDLTNLEKEFLVIQGRAAALAFLVDQRFPDGPDPALAIRVAREAEETKSSVKSARRRRLVKRFSIGVAALVLSLGAALYATGVLFPGNHRRPATIPDQSTSTPLPAPDKSPELTSTPPLTTAVASADGATSASPVTPAGSATLELPTWAPGGAQFDMGIFSEQAQAVFQMRRLNNILYPGKNRLSRESRAE